MLKFAYSCFLALCLISPKWAASDEASPVKGPVRVNAATQDWLQNYLAWAKHHPEVFRHGDDDHAVSLPMPYLDVFSADGAAIYRSGTNRENAAFLLMLLNHVPTASSEEERVNRPSLSDYLHMFPELKADEARILGVKRVTVFAVAYPENSMCKSQNEAIKKLEGRRDIQVVEVYLHRS